MRMIAWLFFFLFVSCAVIMPTAVTATPTGSIPCQVFPADHIWNARIDTAPLHPLSDTYVSSIGNNATLHPDFGSGLYQGEPIGIPFTTVLGSQTPVDIIYTDYGDESDPGPFPIPPNAPVEGGSDKHVLVIDTDNCLLYELFNASINVDNSWNASSGAKFDLNGYALRPDSWTSADAAGLPIFPGLVRYEEVQSGTIHHALRFTAEDTQNSHVWPARHHAGQNNTTYPPMGTRFRLKAGFDISPYPAEVQVILQAMKTYGLILADNGSNWFISGSPNDNWDNNALVNAFRSIQGSNFEAVDVSYLMLAPNSGQTVLFDQFLYVPSLINKTGNEVGQYIVK